MKHKTLFAVLFYMLFVVSGCVTAPPQRGTTIPPSISIEAEAKKKTDRQKQLLSLTAEQYDKVMLVNTTHLKLIKNLKDNNETDKLPTANESYKKQMETILTTEQYAVFQADMGN